MWKGAVEKVESIERERKKEIESRHRFAASELRTRKGRRRHSIDMILVERCVQVGGG